MKTTFGSKSSLGLCGIGREYAKVFIFLLIFGLPAFNQSNPMTQNTNE